MDEREPGVPTADHIVAMLRGPLVRIPSTFLPHVRAYLDERIHNLPLSNVDSDVKLRRYIAVLDAIHREEARRENEEKYLVTQRDSAFAKRISVFAIVISLLAILAQLFKL